MDIDYEEMGYKCPQTIKNVSHHPTVAVDWGLAVALEVEVEFEMYGSQTCGSFSFDGSVVR